MQKALLIIVVLAFAGFASAASTEELQSLWTSWKSYHGRTYTAAEDSTRFAIFVENYYKVISFNAENETPKLGLNRFADLTGSEWKAQYTGSAFVETNKELIDSHTVSFKAGDLPDSVDWRDKGAVTPVKDQGQCGSCWSFSTTGVLEGFYFLNNGNLLSFSEQQIVDCDSANYGCNGGWPYLAVQYAAENGLELESDYPYTAEDGDCSYDASKATTNIASNYSFVTANSTDDLKAAIVTMPVSVLIEADQNVFQMYSSGVIWRNCGNSLDHAVLAVGYEKKGLLDSFIIKNSWATTWGDQGYVYISTNEKANDGTGVCGILSQPLVPTK